MFKNYTIISIEGNIGSGKSTLLNILKQKYKNNIQLIFLDEPIDDWEKIKDSNGNTILKKFYNNQEKYSFAFQMMAYISRLTKLIDSIDNIPKESNCLNHYFIITERSLYTDKNVFAKMLYDTGKMEDVFYQIYLTWFEQFSKNYPVDKVIYVNTNPQKCYERIHKRSRDGEEVIPLNYLEKCNNYHNDFIFTETEKIEMQKTENFCHKTTYNLLVLDGNIDIYNNNETLKTWLKNIENHFEFSI